MEARPRTGARLVSAPRAGMGDGTVPGLPGLPGGPHHRADPRAGRDVPHAHRRERHFNHGDQRGYATLKRSLPARIQAPTPHAQRPGGGLEVTVYVSRADLEDRLRDIQAITDAALSRLDDHELLAELLERTRAILRADTAAVLLLDFSSGELIA